MAGDSFGGSPANLSQKNSSNAKKRDAQSLVPVTIKQLLEAEQKDTKFTVDGRPLSQITVIGSVLSMKVEATNVTYLIDDSTGKISVRIYIDSEEEAQVQTFEPGTYVRCVGNLRSFNDRRNVIGFQLIPVTDFNELTFHYLNVIACHLRCTKQPGNITPAKSPGAAAHSSSFGNPMMGGMPAQPTFQAEADAGGFTSIQNRVLDVFKTEGNDTDAGVSIHRLFELLPQVPQQEIRNTLTFLSDEGHLYTTIDENHFKSTD